MASIRPFCATIDLEKDWPAPLVIGLKRIKNVVLMQVLKQDEAIPRGVHALLHGGCGEEHMPTLLSEVAPGITANRLYIRGSMRAYDHNVAAYTAPDEHMARETVVCISILVREFNRTFQPKLKLVTCPINDDPGWEIVS